MAAKLLAKMDKGRTLEGAMRRRCVFYSTAGRPAADRSATDAAAAFPAALG